MSFEHGQKVLLMLSSEDGKVRVEWQGPFQLTR
jgi:hypothetical protein